MSSSKLFLFSKEVHFNSGVRLLLELYCAILAKFTVVFICTSLPLNLCTSVFGCGCGFVFEQKFWRIDGFGEKKGTDRRICIPLFTPLLQADVRSHSIRIVNRLETIIMWYVRYINTFIHSLMSAKYELKTHSTFMHHVCNRHCKLVYIVFSFWFTWWREFTDLLKKLKYNVTTFIAINNREVRWLN